MIDPEALRRRWLVVWQAMGLKGGDPVYQDLVVRYAEPHRAYHTLDHISDCLFHLDSARHLLTRPAETELALWFHDAIYDPRRRDNEEESARLAEQVLTAAGAGKGLPQRVGDLIRLTTHARVDLWGDGAILCDADLAILGAEPDDFARYDEAIRREYAWVPDDIYIVERGKVLSGLLVRQYIYQTPVFRERFEARAVTNLADALSRYPV